MDGKGPARCGAALSMVLRAVWGQPEAALFRQESCQIVAGGCCRSRRRQPLTADCDRRTEGRFIANAGRYTQNTRIIRCGSQAVDHTLDLQPWSAEVQQETKLQARCLEVVNTLEAMDLVQTFGGFQFDQQHIRYKQIYQILADKDALVFLTPRCCATGCGARTPASRTWSAST